jgi:RimJ/RimL family protein N-acetyltransferase
LDDILRDFPDSFETQRLTIRSPRPDDGPEFNAAVRDSLEGLQTWLERYLDGPPSLEESESLMRHAHARFLLREDLMLLLFLKGTNTLVGSSGLHNIDWQVSKFEIGYWGRTPYQGKGYVTEAVMAITAFAFDKLGARRVQIRCGTDNERSAAVARRAGFTLEGIARHAKHSHKEKLIDIMVFSQVRGDP